MFILGQAALLFTRMWHALYQSASNNVRMGNVIPANGKNIGYSDILLMWFYLVEISLLHLSRRCE